MTDPFAPAANRPSARIGPRSGGQLAYVADVFGRHERYPVIGPRLPGRGGRRG